MIECKICHKEFEALQGHVKVHSFTPAEYRARFGGELISEEARQKLRRPKSNRGQPRVERIALSCPYCGKVKEWLPWEAKGRIGFCCPDHRYALWRVRPETTPNWHGGIAKYPWPHEFGPELKEKIRKRDDYRCQLCGIREEEYIRDSNRRLSIHHINYDKLDCSPLNLIALCNSCNSTVNAEREYWTLIFTDKLIWRANAGEDIRL